MHTMENGKILVIMLIISAAAILAIDPVKAQAVAKKEALRTCTLYLSIVGEIITMYMMTSTVRIPQGIGSLHPCRSFLKANVVHHQPIMMAIIGTVVKQIQPGSSVSIDNRPAYFRLAFLMKNSEASGRRLPLGSILLWYDSVNTIPPDWQICNGSGGTPDLTDRFVLGIQSGQDPGETGGAHSRILADYNMPRHSHTFTTGEAGGHSHTYRLLTFFSRFRVQPTLCLGFPVRGSISVSLAATSAS